VFGLGRQTVTEFAHDFLGNFAGCCDNYNEAQGVYDMKVDIFCATRNSAIVSEITLAWSTCLLDPTPGLLDLTLGPDSWTGLLDRTLGLS
jgi:hypothetical protein